MKLVDPSMNYLVSFRKYINDYIEIDDEFYVNIYRNSLGNFKNYIKLLENHNHGRRLPKGWTAYKTYWLVDYGEVVGVIRIRYKALRVVGNIGYDIRPFFRSEGYGTKILELGLKKAKEELGFKKVYISCKKENLASRRIIEKNKGQFYKKVKSKEDLFYMYIIQL